jgi:hypothetical protein
MGEDEKASRKREAMLKVESVQRILRRWDPIGVQPGHVAPADEYDSYAPHIVSMVLHGCSHDDVCGHLKWLRVEYIGVEEDPSWDREIASEIMEVLGVDSSS